MIEELGEKVYLHKKALSVICIALLSFLLFFSPHFFYPLPFHSEEYDHVRLARSLEGKDSTKIQLGNNWEIGFSVFLRSLDELSGRRLLGESIFLPAVIAFLLGLSAFIFMRFLFNSELIAFLSAVIVLALKSDVTLMGLNFMAPTALGLMLTAVLLYFFVRSTESRKFFFLLLPLFAFTALVHPAFITLFIVSAVLYFIFDPKYFKRNQLKIMIALLIIFLIIPFFSSRLGEQYWVKPLDYSIDSIKAFYFNALNALTFESIYWFKPSLNFIDFLGLPLLALGALGLSAVIISFAARFLGRKQALLEFRREQLILVLYAFVCLAFYSYYQLKGKIFLAPYERMFLIASLLLLFFSATGICLVFSALKKLVYYIDINFFARRVFFLFISLVVLAVILSALLSSSEHLQESLYQNIKLDGISGIEWLKNNSSPNDSIVASPWNSLPINFFAERNIFSTPQTRAGQGSAYGIKEFFEAECEDKAVQMKQEFNSRIVFVDKAEKGLNCTPFEKMYEEDNYSIYFIRGFSN
ncbi:MAG: hypothetical protein AB1467_01785 [Candidatus Diapherotrites archaeon]